MLRSTFSQQVKAAVEEGCYLNMPYWFSKAMAKLEAEKFLGRMIEASCIIPTTGQNGALHINLTRSGDLVLKDNGMQVVFGLQGPHWKTILASIPVNGLFPVSDKRDNQFVYKITHCEMDGQRISSSPAQEAVLAELLSHLLEFSHAQGRLNLPQTKAHRDFRRSNYVVRIDPNADDDDVDPDVLIADDELARMERRRRTARIVAQP